MSNIIELTELELENRIAELEEKYKAYMRENLKLDMSRGKPASDQLDISLPLLDNVGARLGFYSYGIDTRNYGVLDGLEDIKGIFAEIFSVDKNQVIVGGNSSLNMMYNFISMAVTRGLNGQEPWMRQEKVKFLCPSPGYDRHFAVTESFGIELITVDMDENGPVIEQVEEYVKDPTVKGIWAVPRYSNPTGITYSSKVVKGLASLKPAAKDFCIMWDNAYCVHHLNDVHDELDDIYYQAKKHGNEDMVVMFTSTSKMTFPGAGVAAMAASQKIIAQVLKVMAVQTIGNDKINMLRHVNFFKNLSGINEHMKLHAAMLRPKFKAVTDALEKNLAGKGVAAWTNPKGGYFICVQLMDGCAKETVRLLADAGVVMTPAGATHPYGSDKRDSAIRVAPTYPEIEELETAMELFCVCAELACLKKLSNKK